MNIIVQKFGGTSVRDGQTRREAAKHVLTEVNNGKKVVVVVSAMGRKGDPYATDTLLGLLSNQSALKNRDRDLFISCGEVISAAIFTDLLLSMGLQAKAVTGAQAGIRTNENFGNARIIDLKCQPLVNALHEHDVIVVAGFQGMTPAGEVATLGRGGSDTSAVALAAALHAERADIFTDVDGIMTADPTIVQDATTIHSVTYEEICNLAYQGAKVIHPRAVEIAMQSNLPVKIRSTLSHEEGTLITGGFSLRERVITSIAYMPGITQITVRAKENLNVQTDVFKSMSAANISVDFINIQPASVVYTVPDERKEEAVRILKNKGYEPECLPGCAKVSAVGAGMAGVPGVASKIVEALTKDNISIYQSADSHTTIWVLVKGEDMKKAVLALHEAFQLGKSQ
ncbi:aspartate kinase [Alteribacillus iranensis]|uniref:Aspartokinase n=1 Tax=Alteribacillus iranensis TaxID=930128 RepID=A0A1I2A2G5_9BACI|nr:aspartate kinase [Alteribacillus iranensis]SFE37999.1 aspartate kinase [Alteribacillus iranensis]